MNIKTVLMTTVLASFAMSGIAAAQYVGPSDTKTKQAHPYAKTTVATIKADPKDDMKVTLEGNILRKTGHEEYVFSDGTGEIGVEIDDEDFPKERVDQNTKVKIEGEVDTHLLKDADIDVERLTLVK